MNLVYALVAFLIALLFALAGISRVGAFVTERRNPPVGGFATVNGTRMHYVHVPAPASPALPPIVFIHGASANLKDQMLPLRPLLEGRAEMLFLDRPGHGWSGRGDGVNEDPAGQASTIAALLDELGISQAIVVAHSFGGAAATAFALNHSERIAGLVFMSGATHPWPGGKTSWYYDLAAMPFVGRLFTEVIAGPAGMARIAGATECVFAPNQVPEGYVGKASIRLVLRPRAFRSNAIDVQGLFAYAAANAPRYGQIVAATVVISGNRDTVVFEEIHSVGLARDIPNAELVWVRNLGHKPDWIVPELVIAAIEQVAGKPNDLQALARAAEARIAADNFGSQCVDEKAPSGELAPG
jgi:pimeloyl-ACP methyl ester carboxylesterase